MIVVAQFSIFEQVCCGLARGEVALQDTFEDGILLPGLGGEPAVTSWWHRLGLAQRHHRQFVREFGRALGHLVWFGRKLRAHANCRGSRSEVIPDP